MLKKLLLVSSLIFIPGNSLCWEPYEAPIEKNTIWEYLSNGWIEVECPCCSENRLFPSLDFIINRRFKLTKAEENQMVDAVTNYVGDIIPGRLCPFCGVKIPTEKEL